MNIQLRPPRSILALLILAVLFTAWLSACAPGGATTGQATPAHKPKPTATPSPTPSPTVDPTPTFPATVPPSRVLGIVADGSLRGIPWMRVSYRTCGNAPMYGAALRAQINQFHSQGVRVMLSLCQWATDGRLYNTSIIKDATHAGADAVQCGNEQMKSGQYNTYVPPAIFAKFYDLCQREAHAARPDIPVIIGSNDPHVGGIDYYPLVQEVNYFDQMQTAMNASVHPGGHWSWRAQTIGLIDSWHNGYPSQAVNSLQGLFNFWAQQFGVDLSSGGLGKHLWVIEGTGCIYGCGIAASSPYVVAVSHILTLITDVQTSMRYKVPFFYFSARDFSSQGQFWPMGVRDVNDHPKPLRQDLPMGARTLTLTCPAGEVNVVSQERLLAELYAGCALPDNYVSFLTG
jgi:hypothetical protein